MNAVHNKYFRNETEKGKYATIARTLPRQTLKNKLKQVQQQIQQIQLV